MCCPDDEIDDEGARALSEALKTNTTLTELKLHGVQGRWLNFRQCQQQHQETENEIGVEGAEALSEALKTNTTLQSLDLYCEQEESKQD